MQERVLKALVIKNKAINKDLNKHSCVISQYLLHVLSWF